MRVKQLTERLMYMEKQGKDAFFGIKPPHGKEDDDFIEKIAFKKGGKDEVFVELKYNRVQWKKVSLHDITEVGIDKFEEMCFDVLLTTMLNSSLLSMAIAYNLCYIRTRLIDSSVDISNGLDISEVFNKKYYDGNSEISVETFTEDMMQYFDIIAETDTEILLNFKTKKN